MLDRVQARLVRSRSGSVLILVVVLVVLLALMGTALLNTTKGDRGVAAQHSINTQVDLLLEGVKEIAKSAIIGDEFGLAHRFQPVGSGTLETYEHWDASEVTGTLTTQNDAWLAPRVPVVYKQGQSPQAVFWPSISFIESIGDFDAPYACGTLLIADSTVPTRYTQRVTEQPGVGSPFVLTPVAIQPVGFSRPLPAWILPPDSISTKRRFVVAGDADGDGIADSGLFKLPIGQLDGLTYFAGIRIVDNNSAINLNTAFSQTADAAPADTTLATPLGALGNSVADPSKENNLGVFRSHVGLIELLGAGSTPSTLQREAMDKYRFGGTLSATPVADDGVARTDFVYTTRGEAMEFLNQHVGNPGYPANVSGFGKSKQFSLSHSSELAHRFVLPTPGTKGSLDRLLTAWQTGSYSSGYYDAFFKAAGNFKRNATDTVSDFPAMKREEYPADKAGNWFDDNFNWDDTIGSFQYPLVTAGTIDFALRGRGSPYPDELTTGYARPLRSILTTHNPVSNAVQIPTMALPLGMRPWRTSSTTPKGSAIKADLNTAPFEDLWRAYWCSMVTDSGSTGFAGTGALNVGMAFDAAVPYASQAGDHPQRMFRSSIRDPRNSAITVIPENQAILRAAAAAVQTVYMRNPAIASGAPTYRTIQLNMSGLPTGTAANVTIFPMADQPFITEVFVWYDVENFGPTSTDTQKNTVPYVAIELFNPFDQDIIVGPANPYCIRIIARDPTFPEPTSLPATLNLPNMTIRAGMHVVIDNSNDPGFKYFPVASQMPTGVSSGTDYFPMGSDLTAVIGKEMVIVRTDPANTAIQYEKPIDSFDFTGFDPNPTEGMVWHYERPHTNNDRWQCVYPGRYDISKGATWNEPRQQGIDRPTNPWNPFNDRGELVWTPLAPVTLGKDSASNTLGKLGTVPSNFRIPLSLRDTPSVNRPVSGLAFPFGQFARNGDVVQVPLIAAYTVTVPDSANPTVSQLIEMNSISMDAAFAEDTVIDDDPTGFNIDPYPNRLEQLGHFSPVRTATVNDLDPTITVKAYPFALRVLDYVTVQSPASDYLPNISPVNYPVGGTRPVPVNNNGVGAAGADEDDPAIPSPANQGTEDAIGVQGLININTAPWRVLAAIPWVPAGQNNFGFDPSSGVLTNAANDRGDPLKPIDDNEDIAKAIVYWRDGSPGSSIPAKGPFRSLFDLYRIQVPAGGDYLFDYIQSKMNSTEPGIAQGDFTGTDGIRFDAKEQNLILAKVSNLLTTRSDSFTVYIVIQGWRLPPPGSEDTPEMVVQRRAAFIQDRSTVTANNPTLPAAVNVPND